MAEWTWVPDHDGTPDKPIAKPPAAADAKSNQATGPGASGEADGNTLGNTNDAYSAEKLARWKPGQLKELLTSLGLDASGCREKQDIVDKVMRHPGGATAAAEAATARGEPVIVAAPKIRVSGQDGGGGTKPVEETDDTDAAGDGEEQDGFVGMTLADYMGRPTEEAGNDAINGGGGGGGDARPGGAGGGRPSAGDGGTRGGGPPSVVGSTNSGKAELSSAASGRGGRVVRLAPAHIAPPSRPAPEWVVVMQVGVSHERQCAQNLTTYADNKTRCIIAFDEKGNAIDELVVKPTAERIPAPSRCLRVSS